MLGACVSGLFVYVYQTRIFFVSTVLVTHMVGAATYLLEVGGCMLVIASLVGFAAVITKRPPVIIAVRVTFRFSCAAPIVNVFKNAHERNTAVKCTRLAGLHIQQSQNFFIRGWYSGPLQRKGHPQRCKRPRYLNPVTKFRLAHHRSHCSCFKKRGNDNCLRFDLL